MGDNGGHNEHPNSSGTRPPTTYEQWAALIAEHFFRPENDGIPIVLYVDDEIVAAIAGSQGVANAVHSLISAVRSRLHINSANMFSRIRVEALDWSARGKREVPPFTPAIALATLAAARMAAEGEMRSTNYYRRFWELLGLSGSGAPPGYGDTFPLLWRYLIEWLDDVHRGHLGRSTIAQGSWPFIGYSLSQTVMKRSDHDRLGELFDAMDLVPGDTEVNGEELLVAYQWWAPRGPLSSAARHAAARPECAPQLQAILSTEFRLWDGNTVDEHGNRLASVHLAMELSPIEMFLIAARPRGFPATLGVASDDGAHTTLRSTIDGWYDPLDGSITEALTSGLLLQASGFTFRLAPADLIILRQDMGVGAWVSVREVQPYTTHCALVRDRLLDKVRAYLTRYAESGWQLTAPSRRLPAGWTLIKGIAVSEPPDASVGDELAALVPAVKGRVALAGGLPMPSLIAGSHNWYLLGGEPDVWVPRWSSAGPAITVSVDTGVVGSLVAGGRLRLAGHALLPGPHEVTVGSSRRHFLTVAPPAEQAANGEGQLAHRLYRSRDGFTLAPPLSKENASVVGHQVWVTGALVSARDDDLPPPPAEVIRLRRGAAEYRLIGAVQGQVLLPTPGREPAWLRDPSVRLQANFFDAVATFPVVWAMWRWRSTGWSVRLINPLEPVVSANNARAGDDLSSVWSASFDIDARSKEDARELWSRYAAAARRSR
jgi:hypothetical protein